MRNKKIAYFACGLVLLLTLNVSVTSAAEFRVAGEGGNVTISPDESVKNLYTAGNMVSISGRVRKDLYAAGNIITINGNVEDNIVSAGNTVVIKGDVGGNVHAGAGNIIIEGRISEDLFLAGGNIIISKSAYVGGDLVVGAGTIDIQGPVMGNLSIGGGEVTINSKINGEIDIKAEKLNLGSSAVIVRDLKYFSSKEAKINDKARVLGAIDFNKKEVKHADKTKALKIAFGVLSIFFLIKLLVVITTGLVLVYLFERITKNIVKESLNNFWGSLGIGFAALFSTPILAIILSITVVGLYLAGLLMVIYLLLILLSSVLASIAFGSWMMKTLKKKKDYSIGWAEVVFGAIVLKITWFIPFIGWLICFIFFLISLGAFYKLTHQTITKK